MARKVIKACGGSVRGKTVALLGLTFKPTPTTCATRPRWRIVAGLQDAGARIVAYDPEGMDHARTLMPEVTYAEDALRLCRGRRSPGLVTEWKRLPRPGSRSAAPRPCRRLRSPPS